MDAITATATAHWFLLLLLLPCILLFLTVAYLATRPHRPTTKTSNNHVPPCTYPIIGNLPAFLRNRHRFLDWSTDLLLSATPYHTIEVRGPLLLSSPGLCTADPLAVDRLLRSNFPNYVKGSRFRLHLSDLLGTGIFSADGPLWSLQRKIASREFTTRSLRSFVADTVRNEIRDRLLPLLSAAASSATTLDLQDVFRRFAFDNICTIAFGTDPAALTPHLHQQSFFIAFDEAVEISAGRLYSPVSWIWRAKRALNVGSERRLRHAINAIDDYAMDVIALKEEDLRRRRGSSDDLNKQDLLSRFMNVEEDAAEIGDKKKFLRDIVVSFILAGKDSTSLALTWLFWLLWANPPCERRVYAEVSELGEDVDVLYDELKGMHYLHAAVSEALRLYPPVPINSRIVVADDELLPGSSARVEAGWFADYSAYAMGRSEAVWGEDCREYKPERWLDEKGEFVPAEPCRFPVFHAGPRACLGREMAYVQIKAVAAAVLREFVVEAVGDGSQGEVPVPPAYEMSLTLRMKGGFPVKLKRRMARSG